MRQYLEQFNFVITTNHQCSRIQQKEIDVYLMYPKHFSRGISLHSYLKGRYCHITSRASSKVPLELITRVVGA